MEQQTCHILLIDDDEDDFFIVRQRLAETRHMKFLEEWAPSFPAGREAMGEKSFDAVLVDYRIGIDTGIELIREAVTNHYPAPIILLTGQGSYEVDLEAMQAGAADYINKAEMNSSLLERSIRYAIERKRAERELDRQYKERSIILESIQDGLFGLDRSWNITYINSRAARNGGFEPEDLVGKNIWEVFPRLKDTPIEENYRRAMVGRTPVVFEMRGVYHGRWYSISVYPSAEGISVYWQDITKSKQSEETMRAHQVQMETQRRLLEYREKERQKLAHNLHDGPVQELSSILFQIRYAKETIKNPEVEAEIGQISVRLQDTIKSLREMMYDLRPPSLIRFGLSKTIQTFAEEIREKNPSILLETALIDDGNLFSEQVRLSLFRITQEALINAIKHSDATKIGVQLAQLDHHVILEIRDNGKGFSLPDQLIDFSTKGSFGLVGMKERAEAIGGEFKAHSSPGNGTVIRVTVPIDR
jgi:PAS domain S-box-containing protein